jgi:hypothetical protein
VPGAAERVRGTGKTLRDDEHRFAVLPAQHLVEVVQTVKVRAANSRCPAGHAIDLHVESFRMEPRRPAAHREIRPIAKTGP